MIGTAQAAAVLAGALIFWSAVDSMALQVAIACAVGSLIFLAAAGRFRTRMIPDFVGQLQDVAGSIVLGTVLPVLALDLAGLGATNVRTAAGLGLVLFTTIMAADWTAAAAISRLRVAGHLRSRAVMIGSSRLARELEVELEVRPEYGVDVVAVLYESDSGLLRDRLRHALEVHRADRVIVAPASGGQGDTTNLVAAIRFAVQMRVPVFVVPRLYELGIGLDSMSPDRARGYPLMRLQRSAHPVISFRLKRALDVFIAAVVLVCASPLMAAAALGIKLSMSGPVLFRQHRVGQGGNIFEILKFRTMSCADNEHAERFSQHRVTALGRLLRATAIDELPQLWNILRGDMSLVGPRPERVAFVEEGLKLYDDYADRHRMPMGLTGLAQVAGLRGEDTSIRERVKFDNLYVDQWSFGLDLQILLKTFFAIVLQTRYRRRQRELQAAIGLLDDPSKSAVVDLTAAAESDPRLLESA